MITALKLCEGSPPQVRVKGINYWRLDNPGRITPAGAGKSDASIEQASFGKDHPRRCG
ncbi:conserved hypothetical protein [Pseudolactococcus piscium]|nr:conserved hypothetical protein [Lactococcus piscium]